ncbi:MAG: hypothetical protein A3J29_11380 [Acidobacteria bacterium RIFCSPLOWO2_12_FULL_67_14b]|nr:MAG: hypothetical protein A3J29_11380 [Acidobacteria bacterium RIFCSPLOWO2_12_FULL_67_14b]
MTAQRALAALALVFALAHVPFLATSLEDIDSVNFALGLRDFNVAEHRPHPPGYPVYIALGKAAKAIVGSIGSPFDSPSGLAQGRPPESSVEARALAVLSLLGGLLAIAGLYGVFSCLNTRRAGESMPWTTLDVGAFAATAITVSCPLFWYLAVRPMSDLPGLALALAAQACLMRAFWQQAPGPDGDRRLSPAATASSGRMIVVGSLVAALSIGMRSQTVWFTVPLLVLVLFDRVGRGVAGAMIGGGVAFVMGGLAWGIPLLVASGGLGPYLAALGTQAGEDFAAGEMLYLNQTARSAAFALLRTFVHPWDSTTLAIGVLLLAAAGVAQLLWRDRRALVALIVLSVPYAVFHLLFQDTSFVRYALPLVPAVALLAVRGVTLISERAVPVTAAVVSIWAVAVASPVLVAYGSEPSPTVRVIEAMTAEARGAQPGALAMHQTFRRPLEAEVVPVSARLPSPPRLEWLELEKYWNDGRTDPIWFLADPVRTDLALIDPMSLRDATEFRWPLVARPAFGGMRPSAVRWYRMPAPGWFAEDGWSLTPETSGMARLRGKEPHLAPIAAMVRRRAGAARLLVGGRNLAAPTDPSARFVLAIDGVPLQQWDAAPGFFLHVFDVPAGRLSGEGPLARLTIRSAAIDGPPSPDGLRRAGSVIPTAIEQFDLQDPQALMWGYDAGWLEAEYNPSEGLWRWTSDRATLRIVAPSVPVRVTLSIESPLRYFDAPARVRVSAGAREIAVSLVGNTQELTTDVPADALAAAGGLLTVETDKTFVPAERGGPPDHRRLGLRVFGIRVSKR